MQGRTYQRLYWIAALACVTALVYWPSTKFLSAKWVDGASLTYTHGWLILVVCIALVVRSRRELAAAPVQPSARAAVALAAVIIVWLIAYRASIEGLEVPLQPLLFWLAVTAALGWQVGRLLLFPVAYLYFAQPIWYGAPLQALTIWVMRGALAVTGPPALVQGDFIHLSNGTFIIEEGCSGLHFMIVGLAVAALYGEQRLDSWPVRVRQLALMAVLALLANWVRVYTVIQAGYLTNMQSYLVRVSHYGFGWGVFAVALLVFFWLAPYLGPESPPPPVVAVPVPPTPAVWRAELTGVALAVAILLALPALNMTLRRSLPAAPLANPAASLNPQSPWQAVPLNVRSAWLPMFPAADELQRRAFGTTDDDSVEVFGVAYRIQRQGAELVGENSSVLGDGLQTLAERVVRSPVGRFHEAEAIDRTGARSLIWWRYQVAGRNLVGPFMQQLWYGINALVWRPAAGLIALRTTCHNDCSSARSTLEEFVAHSDLR
jgi:exosortase